MKCPNCDHSKFDTLPSGWFWCRRCGTILADPHTHTPSMVEDYQRLVRKVDHGCTDAQCDECDPAGSEFYCKEHRYNPKPNSGMAFCPQCEGLPADLDELDRIVNKPARDLWLPNIGRDHPNANEEVE